MTAAATERFRERYRAAHIPARYSGPLHLAGTVAITAAVLALAIHGLDDVRPLEWLTIPAAFLYANLVEYLGHRFVMHRRVPGFGLVFERHTLQHHRFFTHENMRFDSTRDYRAVLFPLTLIVFFFAGFGIPSFALVAWLFGANVAWLFVATAIAYYLNYELLHFAYHTAPDSRIARLPWMSRLRALHTTHHDPAAMQTHNFNITYPICDWLFGTWRTR